MSYNWGRETADAKALAAALNNNQGTKRNVGVKPAVTKQVGFANGGAVRLVKFYAKGGKVKHDDAAQDKKLIKKMMAEKGMSKGGKVKGYAAGGAAKVRKGQATQSGKPIMKPRTSRVGTNGGG